MSEQKSNKKELKTILIESYTIGIIVASIASLIIKAWDWVL